MTCATCSAAIFGPLVQGGVSVHKIAERAMRAAETLPHRERGYVQALADTAKILAAEAAMKGEKA